MARCRYRCRAVSDWKARGRVTAIGPDVKNVAVGDRVGYALGPLGSYATGRLYPANRLVKLPDAIKSEDAAAVIFKGITAQYLIKSTFPVKSGRFCSMAPPERSVRSSRPGRSTWEPS
jgi:NADPH:quinone reductase-like Zn-dependent oxidoreductase